MISLEPAQRPTFDALLHSCRGTLFPDSFYSTFHDFISSVNDISISSPFSNVLDTSTKTSNQVSAKTEEDKVVSSDPASPDLSSLPADSDRRIMRTWADFDILEPHFSVEQDDMDATAIKVDYATNYSSFKPLQVCYDRTNCKLVC